MSEKLLISLTFIVAILLIFFGIYFQSKSLKENENLVFSDFKKVDIWSEVVLGNKDPEIFIIEYSDLECPGCKRYNNMVSKKIINKWSDKVGFVYRHVPLKKHPSAIVESVAIECAAKLKGEKEFEEFKNIIFEETSSNGNFSTDRLIAIAMTMGINKIEFTECLANEDIKKKVTDSYNQAIQSGIKITPTIFALFKNGEVRQLAPDYNVINKSIESYFSN